MNKTPLISTSTLFTIRSGGSVFLLVVFIAGLIAQTPQRQTRYIAYSEAQPLLQLMDEILPAELKGKPPEQQSKIWPEWVKSQDAAVRARLRQGDEDTMVNFLLFGTSFTKQSPMTVQELNRLKVDDSGIAADKTLTARIDDLIRGLAAPGKNERLSFLRKLVAVAGHQFTNAGQRARFKNYLLANLARVLREQESYTKTLEAARALGNVSEEFAERSKLYRTRGLSLDTSLSPNFAIEESLKAMLSRGLMTAGSVRRVAVIGPGLDFTDKAAGYDFYPQQTIQPFAVLDSLLRLGLAKNDELQLTAFDISPRILDHLTRASQNARQGIAYTVQLPLDIAIQWKPGLKQYWQDFGNQIGQSVKPLAAPEALKGVERRAIRIHPKIVASIKPVDLNVVYQQLGQPGNFDLIIATNILVYYDLFEQSLALANVESLLRPGGIMLSNNALLELPATKMKSVGYQTTVYSDRADDGDHIVWYRRSGH